MSQQRLKGALFNDFFTKIFYNQPYQFLGRAMKTTKYSFLYWSMAALFYLYEMVLRASSGVLENDLRESFLLNAGQFGLLNTMYYWAYTPLQIPCGLILDKMGARRLLTLSCVLCAFSSIIFGLTSSQIVASVARFLIGAGSACAFISALALVIGWFSPTHFAVMTGMTTLMGCVGGIIANAPTAYFSHLLGWRQTMIGFGVIGILLAITIWCIVKDPQLNEHPPSSLLKDLISIMKKKQIWLAGIIGGFLYLPISVFAEAWATPFFQATYHIDAETASLATTAIYIGFGLGGPIAAWISNYVRNYVFSVRWAALLGACLFVCITFSHYLPFRMVIILSGILGVILGAEVLTFIIAKDNMPLSLGGSTTGFTNGLTMFFGLLFQPLFGAALDILWKWLHGSTSKGIALYTAQMYQYAMLIFPICFAITYILSRYLKDTFLAQKESPNTL